MKENKKDIKEILELLDAIKLLSVNFAIAFKDDKIGLDDLPILLNFLKEIKVIIDGAKGIEEIPSEIKDLDKEEIIRLGSKVYEIIRSVKEKIEN